MAKKNSELFYDIIKLHKIFAVVSFAFLATIVFAVWDDYDREWKHYQDLYWEMRVGLVEKEKESVEAEYAKVYDSLRNELKQVSGVLTERKAAIEAKEAEKVELRGRVQKADQEALFAKAAWDVSRWYWEEAQHKLHALEEDVKANHATEKELNAYRNGGFKEAKEKYEADTERLRNGRLAKEDLDAQVAAIDAAIDELRKEELDLAADVKAATLERERVNLLLEDIRTKSLTHWRNFPLLDAVNKNIKINQYVLPQYSRDVYFANVERVDRCTTCHLSIDTPGFELGEDGLFENEVAREWIEEKFAEIEDEEVRERTVKQYSKAYATHPQVDLFVGSASEHPIVDFGCTVCHSGQGRATTFVRSGHTPNDHHQQEEWKEHYNWKADHYWEYPQIPMKHVTSQCYKCHSDQLEIAEAEPLNEGRKLVERFGCWSCHKVEGFETLKKPGPPLDHIAQKTTPDWMVKWLENPKSYNLHAKMPAFFDQTNTREPFWRLRDQVEIEAMVGHFFPGKSATPLKKAPDQGTTDVTRGEDLFQRSGCVACHTTETPTLAEGDPANEDPFLFPEDYDPLDRRNFGPNLSSAGSKLDYEWLYNWLRDPMHWWEDTGMPNLRLSEQEAADIAAYLLTLKNEDFEKVDPRADITGEVVTEYAARRIIYRRPETLEAAPAAIVVDMKAIEEAGKLSADARMQQAILGMQDEIYHQMQLKKVGARAAMRKTVESPDEWKKEEIATVSLTRYGCYSCHDIQNFEHAEPPLGEMASKAHPHKFAEMAPIGVELSGAQAIGSKPVRLLAFNYQGQVEPTRHGWLQQKVYDPRIFDGQKDLAPDEKSRMPRFGFSQEQAQRITTFLLGLVKDKIAKDWKKQLDPHELAVEEGEQLVYRSNCMSCHVFQLDELDVVVPTLDEEGNPTGGTELVTLVGEITETDRGDKGWIKQIGLWRDEPYFGKNGVVGKKLRWELMGRTKGLHFSPEQIVDRREQRGGDVQPLLEEYLSTTGIAKPTNMLPPLLYEEGLRVQSPWLFRFLTEPHVIRPATDVVARLRMPTYGFNPDEAMTLVQYFNSTANAPDDPHAAVLEFINERTPDFVNRKLEEDGQYFEKAHSMIVNPDVNCRSCHFVNGLTPTSTEPSWAPELSDVKDRLRPEWVKRWIFNPQSIISNTAMTRFNWGTDAVSREGVFSEAGDEQGQKQVEAIRDYLYNLDRAPEYDFGLEGGSGESND